MAKIRNSAEFTRAAQLLLAGITIHAADLDSVGVDTQFITEFETRYNNLMEVINTQQATKSQWMDLTAQRQITQEKLEEYYRRAKKLVKLELDEAAWRACGITDKW